MRRPTVAARDAINELLRRNGRTTGAVAGDIYLGTDLLAVRLIRPKVIEGQWEDVPMSRTADLFDLMDAHQAESGN